MKNGILFVGLLLALTPTVFAFVTVYQRPCGTGVDLCTWDKALPLGSPDTASCGLSYNTPWDLNTDTDATCTFDGTNLQNTKLYISIDNDVINCTLNGVAVFNKTIHDNCAPVDPRDGYNLSLTPAPGTNTLVCYVSDRGVMDHFDACVVGQKITPTPAPEFPFILVPLAITAIAPVLGYYISRKQN